MKFIILKFKLFKNSNINKKKWREYFEFFSIFLYNKLLIRTLKIIKIISWIKYCFIKEKYKFVKIIKF
jgi:hypothetical protein